MAARPDARAAAWWEGFRTRQLARARGTCCEKHKAERATRGRECERVACDDRRGKAFALLVLPGVPANVRRLVVCKRCRGAIEDHRFPATGAA